MITMRNGWFRPTEFKIGLLAAVVMALAFGFLPSGNFLNTMDRKWADQVIRNRAGRVPAPEVVIAAIDAKSVDTFGRWPWSRSTMAQLVSTLNDHYQVNTIGFDVVFSEPNTNDSAGDSALGMAIAAQDNVVMSFFFYMDEKSIAHRSLSDLADSEGRIAAAVVQAPALLSAAGRIPIGRGVESSIAVVGLGGASAGYFNVIPDKSDGTIRRMHLLMGYQERIYPALALSMLRHFSGKSAVIEAEASPGGAVREIRVGNFHIQPESNGSVRLNFRGRAGTFPHFSVADIIGKTLPRDRLKNTMVLIGATEPGIFDLRVTPVDPAFPGVELHATLLDNLLTDSILGPVKTARRLTVGLILLLGGSLGWLLGRRRIPGGFALTVGAMAAYTFLQRWLVAEQPLWPSYIFIMLTLAAVWIGVVLLRQYRPARAGY